MNIQEGYTYHLKDKFFKEVKDSKLMKNKENGRYRPIYFAIRDTKNKDIIWMIPLSSKVTKYTQIRQNILKKYGKCSTIIIDTYLGRQQVFLIQNAFPTLEKYISHEHKIQGKPTPVHTTLQKDLEINLNDTLVLYYRGFSLFYADVGKIYHYLEQKLNNQRK